MLPIQVRLAITTYHNKHAQQYKGGIVKNIKKTKIQNVQRKLGNKKRTLLE